MDFVRGLAKVVIRVSMGASFLRFSFCKESHYYEQISISSNANEKRKH